MTLRTAHRILIAAAIVCFAVYAGLEFAGRIGPGGRARGGLSLLAALGLGLYFVTLRRQGAGGGR